MRPKLLAASALLALLSPGAALAQMEELVPIEDDTPDGPAEGGEAGTAQGGGMGIEERTIDERQLVLSAARTRTTIQEAPGIITVITAEEIRQRGYRTVNDALRSVPGFLGGRRDSNGWFDEVFSRGTARTVLVLVNGVNVTEPVRNGITLDRKIPMDAIKRIEVTSGPGGVLWGSNALLGVINIILKDSDDLDGLQLLAGGGHGAAQQEAVKAHTAYGDEWLGGDIKLYTSIDFYSDRGSELQVDAIKVLGVLPEPAIDGLTIYENRGDTTDFNSRDWWLTSTLSLQLFEHVTLEWLATFERDHRQIATGGAILRGTQCTDRCETDDPALRAVTRETVGDDSLQMVALSWRDRFLEDRFGISAKIYGVRFNLTEDPFWAFPPRDLGRIPLLDEGVEISLDFDRVWRFGANVDADVKLPWEHHLIFGAEVFQEQVRDAVRGDTLRTNILVPSLADPGSDNPLVRDGVFGPGRCPPPGTHSVQVGEQTVDVAFGQDCRFSETVVLDTNRTVGAFYVSDEWKPVSSVALQPGFRLQLSDTYDPVTLLSGAMVWNVVDQTYLKLNYAEGFRPPELQSTRINARSISSVTFLGDPNLNVEQSRAAEAEVNTILFEDIGVLQRIYLRGDYAYTVLSDLVRNVGGRFSNSGERGIHSVEFLARADFRGNHELWFGGNWVLAEDSVSGPIRNIPNWVFMGGGRLRLFSEHLELMTLGTFIGPQEDLVRAADTGQPFRTANTDFVLSRASDVEVYEIDPYLLLRFGVRVLKLWEDRLEVEAFVYNALAMERNDPDFFFDDRVQSRPQPREGWSAFGQARVRLF